MWRRRRVARGAGQPAELADQAEQRRPPHGGAEHGATTASIAVERIVGRGAHGGLDRPPPARAAASAQHGVDELVLAGEPVQHVCLATPTSAAIVVERHGVDAARRRTGRCAATSQRSSTRRLASSSTGDGRRHGSDRTSLPIGRRRCARHDRVIAEALAGQAHRHHRGAPGSSAPRSSSGCCAACPTASWCCSSATASARRPPSGCAGRSSRTTPSTACAPSSAAGRRSTTMVARRITTIAGDVGTDGLGLNDADRAVLAGCDIVIHSAAAVSFDSPLDSAVEINLLGPTRIADTLQRRSASRPTSSPCRRATSPATAAATRPRSWSATGPFDLGLDWRERGRRRPPPAQRRRGRQPRSPTSSPSSATRPARELGAAGAPALAAKTEQLRERWVTRPARRGRPGPRRQRRLARRLRVHQGARRAGADRRPRATCRSASCARRSSSRRWPSRSPGWIRGFRMAEPVIISYARGLLQRVPRRARGHGRRHPGRPRRRRDHRRRRPRARARRRRSPRSRPGGVNPLKYRTLVDNVSELVHRAPAVRRRGPADRRARVALPRPRPGAGPAAAGQDGDRPRREGAAGAAAARQAGRVVGQARGRKRIEVERALEYVELYGLYTECEAIYQVDNLLAMWDGLDADRPGRRSTSTRASSTGRRTSREIHLPSIVQHARVKTDARQDAAPTAPAGCAAGARTRAPRRRVRPREHADRQQRRRELLVAGHPPARPRRAAPLRAAHAGRGAGAAELDRNDRGDFLRHFYRRYEDAPVDQIDEDARRAAHPADPHQELPGRHPPGPRAPRPRAPHGPDHRRARLRRRGPAAAVRRDRRRRDDGPPRRHATPAR